MGIGISPLRGRRKTGEGSSCRVFGVVPSNPSAQWMVVTVTTRGTRDNTSALPIYPYGLELVSPEVTLPILSKNLTGKGRSHGITVGVNPGSKEADYFGKAIA